MPSAPEEAVSRPGEVAETAPDIGAMGAAPVRAPASARGVYAAPAAKRDPRGYHPFLRLARLLDPLTPGRSPAADNAPINLSIGDPQVPPPRYVLDELAADLAPWGRYPAPRGEADYRRACVDYLERRYDLPAGMVDPDRHVLPVPGTREGLFFAAMATAILAEESDPGRTAVLLPSPGYHVYMGAAAVAGLSPVFVPAPAETDFLPDYASLPAHLLGTAQLAYLCSPANPQGAALDLEGWRRVLRLARGCGFALAADECYGELWLDTPPAGALQAAAAEGGGLDKLLVFHSLSKRASAAGLRCGFVAGDPDLVDRIDACLRMGGAGVPLPVQRAGARLWRDAELAERTRATYRELFAVAERVLHNRFGYRRPAGGFFLWLDVGHLEGGGEAAAEKLWREAGLKVLPGAYMAGPPDLPDNAGERYIRVALVYDPQTTEAALRRLVEVLGD
jgi:aspartate/methionine/tyrosine aminotransferase